MNKQDVESGQIDLLVRKFKLWLRCFFKGHKFLYCSGYANEHECIYCKKIEIFSYTKNRWVKK